MMSNDHNDAPESPRSGGLFDDLGDWRANPLFDLGDPPYELMDGFELAANILAEAAEDPSCRQELLYPIVALHRRHITLLLDLGVRYGRLLYPDLAWSNPPRTPTSLWREFRVYVDAHARSEIRDPRSRRNRACLAQVL